MCLLVESIKIVNRKLQNIDYHNRRFNQTRRDLFGITSALNLADFINLNKIKDDTVYKCRIIYDVEIQDVEFIPYAPKPIKSLQLVADDHIDYSYKYKNRSVLIDLKKNCTADDILIIKNDEITDLSFANIAFFTSNNEVFTPLNPLLKGTMRQYLLDKKLIKTYPIKVSDLHLFDRAKPINAMLNFEQTSFIDIKHIFLNTR